MGSRDNVRLSNSDIDKIFEDVDQEDILVNIKYFDKSRQLFIDAQESVKSVGKRIYSIREILSQIDIKSDDFNRLNNIIRDVVVDVSAADVCLSEANFSMKKMKEQDKLPF